MGRSRSRESISRVNGGSRLGLGGFLGRRFGSSRLSEHARPSLANGCSSRGLSGGLLLDDRLGGSRGLLIAPSRRLLGGHRELLILLVASAVGCSRLGGAAAGGSSCTSLGSSASASSSLGNSAAATRSLGGCGRLLGAGGGRSRLLGLGTRRLLCLGYFAPLRDCACRGEQKCQYPAHWHRHIIANMLQGAVPYSARCTIDWEREN